MVEVHFNFHYDSSKKNIHALQIVMSMGVITTTWLWGF